MNIRVKRTPRKQVQFLSRTIPMAIEIIVPDGDEPYRDTLQTETSQQQENVEEMCRRMLNWARANPFPAPNLARERHVQYLRCMLGPLPSAFVSLDASKPWIVYWTCNALALLGDDTSDLCDPIQQTVLAYQNMDSGGFGGGSDLLSHLAASYAAVNALALCGDEKAWEKIDRGKLYEWLMEMKQTDGSFTMCSGGEADTRATYCALAIASLLDIMTPELVENCAEYFGSCQTYEGGFANDPYGEAHGGYAFCSMAGLCLLGSPKQMLKQYIDLNRFIGWLVARQMKVEGGFSGRTNKLVDGCYNHWVGGCWPFVEAALESDKSLWNREALQMYALVCCQDAHGGLVDKPGKRPDTYHTNYVLSGLSGAQHHYRFLDGDWSLGDFAFQWRSEVSSEVVIENEPVKAINPVHVLPEGVAEKMRMFYRDMV